MEEPNTNARVLRFGVFEVDIRAGELRKQGLQIRLQEQPFQVLATLLENAGEVVGRGDLRNKLWPKVIRGKKPVAKPAKNKPIVPLPASWER